MMNRCIGWFCVMRCVVEIVHGGHFLAILAWVGLTHGAPAAIVSLAGSDLNAGPTWRTASVSKPLDLNGDDIYGSDGYLMFNTGFTGSGFRFNGNWLSDASSDLPGYASVSPGPGGLDGSVTADNFSVIDDPLNPGLDFRSGTIARGGMNPGDELGLLNITFSQDFDSTVRLGVLIGNADFGNPSALRLTQSGQPTNSVTVSTGSGVVSQNNFFFFDLDNIAAGDTFVLYGTEDIGDDAYAPFTQLRIGGLTFDDLVVIPEPSLATLVGFGLFVLRSALRRHRSLSAG
jgi:hypothetical protein